MNSSASPRGWDLVAGVRRCAALVTMATAFVAPSAFAASEVTDLLPAWSAGNLYVHHISTGRGNSTYFVFPDGTTLLIDAGEADPAFVESVRPLKAFAPRPDGVHSAAYWIGNYIRQFAPAGRPLKLDYALITHFSYRPYGHDHPRPRPCPGLAPIAWQGSRSLPIFFPLTR